MRRCTSAAVAASTYSVKPHPLQTHLHSHAFQAHIFHRSQRSTLARHHAQTIGSKDWKNLHFLGRPSFWPAHVRTKARWLVSSANLIIHYLKTAVLPQRLAGDGRRRLHDRAAGERLLQLFDPAGCEASHDHAPECLAQEGITCGSGPSLDHREGGGVQLSTG